jgi:hypothetical protein
MCSHYQIERELEYMARRFGIFLTIEEWRRRRSRPDQVSPAGWRVRCHHRVHLCAAAATSSPMTVCFAVGNRGLRTSAVGRGRPDGGFGIVRPVSARKLPMTAIVDHAHLPVVAARSGHFPPITESFRPRARAPSAGL